MSMNASRTILAVMLMLLVPILMEALIANARMALMEMELYAMVCVLFFIIILEEGGITQL